MIAIIVSARRTVEGFHRPAVAIDYPLDAYVQIGNVGEDEMVTVRVEAEESALSSIEADPVYAGKVTRLWEQIKGN